MGMENVEELLALIESIPEDRAAARSNALRAALGRAWAGGHNWCFDGGAYSENPYLKA